MNRTAKRDHRFRRDGILALAGGRMLVGIVTAVLLLPFVVGSLAVGKPPPAEDVTPDDASRAWEAQAASFRQFMAEVDRLDDLMQHRSPCPECGQGGGGVDHPHAMAKSWRPTEPFPPEAIRLEWEKRLSALYRKQGELKRLRVSFEEIVSTLGAEAPEDASKRVAMAKLREISIDRFARAVQRRDLTEYQESLKSLRGVAAAAASSAGKGPDGSPGTSDENGEASTPEDQDAEDPAEEEDPSAGGAGGEDRKPGEPKQPTPEEIDRKKAAARKAISEHSKALSELRPFLDRFDELINHRRNCPQCGGGGGGRDHPHAVFRAWAKTGDFNAEKVRLESTRVQRDIGRCIRAAAAATKILKRLVKDLGDADSTEFKKDLSFMLSVEKPLEDHNATMDRNKWESYDATLGALRAVMGTRR